MVWWCFKVLTGVVFRLLTLPCCPPSLLSSITKIRCTSGIVRHCAKGLLVEEDVLEAVSASLLRLESIKNSWRKGTHNINSFPFTSKNKLYLLHIDLTILTYKIHFTACTITVHHWLHFPFHSSPQSSHHGLRDASAGKGACLTKLGRPEFNPWKPYKSGWRE